MMKSWFWDEMLTWKHTPHAHLVVYHVDFHGATSHMENHVGKLDNLNHDRNHVVIHVVFYNANQTS
jgi:intracellular sulfur oxidation DsrE/DsrF family protein